MIRLLGPNEASRRLLERCAGVYTQDLGYLLALLALPNPNLERRSGRHRAVAAALDHAHVKEGVTAARKLNEAEAFLGIVPLHRG